MKAATSIRLFTKLAKWFARVEVNLFCWNQLDYSSGRESHRFRKLDSEKLRKPRYLRHSAFLHRQLPQLRTGVADVHFGKYGDWLILPGLKRR